MTMHAIITMHSMKVWSPLPSPHFFFHTLLKFVDCIDSDVGVFLWIQLGRLPIVKIELTLSYSVKLQDESQHMRSSLDSDGPIVSWCLMKNGAWSQTLVLGFNGLDWVIDSMRIYQISLAVALLNLVQDLKFTLCNLGEKLVMIFDLYRYNIYIYSRLPHNPYPSVDCSGFGVSGSMDSNKRPNKGQTN